MRWILRSERGEGDALTLWLVLTLVLGLSAAVFFMVATKRVAEVPAARPGTADEGQARRDLDLAVSSAMTYYAENDSFADYSPEVATGLDPRVIYDVSPVSNPGVVSIRSATVTTILFVTEASEGRPLCAAIHRDETVTYGLVDATVPEECTGGWGR